ncbi:Thiosulfate sulfurtransferase rdl2, mitochondrial [Diatrype stigma]|uniref:Thiosulfate sulfurtransferase rdl2, mitochondrial n=1 Tax=Diatrype stigma TaxID=117547 RepID=A0AAN9YHM5_9PEZI
MAMAMAPRRALRAAVGAPARQATTAAAFFGTVSSTKAATTPSRVPRVLPRPRIIATSALQQQRRAVVGGVVGGRGTTTRWSSSSSSSSSSGSDSAPAGSSSNKIWTFEEIRDLTSSPTAKPNVTIIDVREPGEIASTGRIPGAVNIPVTSAPEAFHADAADFEDRFGFARPPADAEVLFYCKAGVRSRAAAGLARDAGWVRVGEYPGSWADWVAKGGKVER